MTIKFSQFTGIGLGRPKPFKPPIAPQAHPVPLAKSVDHAILLKKTRFSGIALNEIAKKMEGKLRVMIPFSIPIPFNFLKSKEERLEIKIIELLLAILQNM